MPKPKDYAPFPLNHDRLVACRDLRGLSKKQVAQAVGISPTAYAGWEKGTSIPDAKHIPSLADVLGIQPQAISATTPALPQAPGYTMHFRALRAMAAPLRRTATAIPGPVGQILAKIDQALPGRPADLPHWTGADKMGRAEIEDRAVELRRRWGIPLEQPISSMVDLLREQGVTLVEIGTATVVDAYSCFIEDRPVVFPNSRKTDAARRELDLGHELFHLCAHRDGIAPDTHREKERQANQFGAALLAPASLLADAWPRPFRPDALFELKKELGLSAQALLYRGKELELISPDQYQRTIKRWTVEWNHQRKLEPQPIQRPRFCRIQEAATVMLQRGWTRDQFLHRFADDFGVLAQLVEHWGGNPM